MTSEFKTDEIPVAPAYTNEILAGEMNEGKEITLVFPLPKRAEPRHPNQTGILRVVKILDQVHAGDSRIVIGMIDNDDASPLNPTGTFDVVRVIVYRGSRGLARYLQTATQPTSKRTLVAA